MSTAVCISCCTWDFMPKTYWYESTKGKALCQRLFYWLVSLMTAPQYGITNVKLGQIIAKWKSVHRKKTPRKLLDRIEHATIASQACSLLHFRISMPNIEEKSVMRVIQNGCRSSKSITVPKLQHVRRLNLNPQIVHCTNLDRQNI